ncbi:MAG: type 1 glutamine amidotransferase [Phycisphaerae bacterium]|nr:type 1 glutamine amidotransferase [Phycisphaerae bacterium]
MGDQLAYLLLQVRNREDPMRGQEVGCFARALGCGRDRIRVFDLLGKTDGAHIPTARDLAGADVVLLGGSGDYSVAEGGDWLEPALDVMRTLVESSKPTFASCWGFQAMARALGGEVVRDMSRAELGTIEIDLTAGGREDPVFGPLAPGFVAPMGHQDIVDRLPEGAVLLASTSRVKNQAFCFAGKPIYCTQFHPELDRQSLIERVEAYPRYVHEILGQSIPQFADGCRDTPECRSLLPAFIEHAFGPSAGA